MDENEVLQAYCNMAGEELEESLDNLPLANVAISLVKSQLKFVPHLREDIVLLNHLCGAMLCLWHWKSEAAISSTGRIKGDGYTVVKNSNSKLKAAQKLYDQWRSHACYLLKDDSFVFTHAEGEDDETVK